MKKLANLVYLRGMVDLAAVPNTDGDAKANAAANLGLLKKKALELDTGMSLLCSAAPSGANCLNLLNLNSLATGLTEGRAAESIAATGLSSETLDAVCSPTPDKYICFQQVLGAATTMLTLQARNTQCSTGLDGQLCKADLERARLKRDAAVALGAYVCAANSDQVRCLSMPDIARRRNPSFGACIDAAAALNATCTPECSQIISTEVKGNGWGCCAKLVLQYIPGLRLCADYWNTSMVLPEKCALRLGEKVVKRSLNLAVRWAALDEATKANLTAALVADTAAKIGVAAQFIVNATLVPSTTTLVNPPSTSMHRMMHVLAASADAGTAFTFAVNTPNDAVTAAAAANYDSSVAAGTMALPESSQMLAAAGIVDPGASVGQQSPSNPPAATSSVSIPMIIGIVAGVAVVALVVTIFIVKLNSGNAGRKEDLGTPMAAKKSATVDDL
jgi:hypothetical protein